MFINRQNEHSKDDVIYCGPHNWLALTPGSIEFSKGTDQVQRSPIKLKSMQCNAQNNQAWTTKSVDDNVLSTYVSARCVRSSLNDECAQRCHLVTDDDISSISARRTLIDGPQ